MIKIWSTICDFVTVTYIINSDIASFTKYSDVDNFSIVNYINNFINSNIVDDIIL